MAQVRKTTHKAMRSRTGDLQRIHTPDWSYLSDVSTVRPRQVVVAGSLSSLTDGGEVNSEKLASFELYRRGELDVEILTFDELFERAKFIVERCQSDKKELHVDGAVRNWTLSSQRTEMS